MCGYVGIGARAHYRLAASARAAAMWMAVLDRARTAAGGAAHGGEARARTVSVRGGETECRGIIDEYSMDGTSRRGERRGV